MSRASQAPHTRQGFRDAPGVLLVLREPPPPPPAVKGQPAAVPGNPAEGLEVLLALWDDGSVTALHGHVDLGTGLRTALAQIVAEEMGLALDGVHLIMGSTAAAPNQGATIASASIQIHAAPLRAAAAQAHSWLAGRDASVLANQHVELMLALDTPVKDAADYRLVGTSAPRVDMTAKVTGELIFVHDMRVPGMLHGRVIRPPYAGADHGDFIGNTLLSVDESSIAHLPGVRRVVVLRDFVGVVAEREEQAEAAMAALQVHWKSWPGLPPIEDIEHALRNNPSTPRRLVDEGDVDAAALATPLHRTYLWPYQLHASIGPSCAVADFQNERMTIWSGTQNPHVLRADLARLTGLADTAIDVVRMEAAGCYGRNGADDVAADAALLSRAVGAPVRVQLTREQEQAWEPKGAAQWMQVQGGLDAQGGIAAWDFETRYPSNGAPTLALLLTRTIEPTAQAYEMGDRTARPPYAAPNLRVTVHDMAPVLRASWLRGVSALPNSFAHESYIDELASAAGADPVAYRLRHLSDPRAAELVAATAQRAGWLPHTAPQQQQQQQPAESDGEVLHGQGFAYARYVHSKWPGFGAAWSAWVADVDVNTRTGEVFVKRVVVGHDAGLLINPAGVQHQIHGNVLQTTSRALKERVELDPQTRAVANREWGSYPILNFRDVPVIDVLHMPRPGQPPLGAGESSSVPGTAAIANAIFDATGVRFREPPFTPEKVRAALNPAPAQAAGPAPVPAAAPIAQRPPTDAPWPRSRSLWAATGALAAGLLGFAAGLVGVRPALAPVAPPDLSIYSAATLERGRQLAAAGNCIECHTAAGAGPAAAATGGRALHTPFGTVHSTNLTPDVATGIGGWSLPAFTRALREGLSRDGRHLYPAFPYTDFAKLSDDDITALYAHLMSLPAVVATAPANDLRFPFNQRPLMALWNGLFHDSSAWQTDPAHSTEWNRGAYLVNGIGHCGACHTERNSLGAERSGSAFLGGAVVDGWEAQPLTAASHAPVPWTAEEFFRYLRLGHTLHHGAAAGPMAAVVRNLQALPDTDLQAIALYLASFNPAGVDAATVATKVQSLATAAALLPSAAQRLFTGACGACHHDGDGPPVLGLNAPLALNSNLHSARPDNLLRVVLHGITDAATPAHGWMPAFRASLSDRQVSELAAYLRARYAPGQPAWSDLPAAVARVRATP